MKKIIFCLSILITTLGDLKSQIKIGNNPNTINSNSLLELESTNKGFLPPRVALVNTNSVTPLTAPIPKGMIVYSSGGSIDDGTYTWDGSSWVAFTLDNSDRTNYVLVKSAADFPAPVGGVITLVAGTFYEINGTVNLANSINLNGCEIDGIDAVNDRLVYTGSGELFTGAGTGTIEFLTLCAPSGKVLNINAGNSTTANLLVENCFFVNSNSLGTIEGVGGYIYFADNGFYNNTNGITFKNSNYVYLNNSVWDISNANKFQTFSGSFNVIQILGGSSNVNSGNVTLDITGITSLANGSIKATLFRGSGTHVIGSFTNTWEVEAIGLDTEKDDVASGNVYMSANASTSFSAVNTPVKVAGTTTSVNLFRVSSPTNNRITYAGTKTRRFLVICSLSFVAAGNNKVISFYVAKNGVKLPESKITSKINTGTDQGAVPLSCTISMTTGDYLEIWVENNTDNTSVTITNMNLAIK